ncbi:MAG: hypothetical protein LR001_05570 [Clostridiales bacterium]|nr:hypothetical protein [Clostridiales bacterium]
MKKRPRDEQERIDKLKDMFLYNIGYEHAQNTCKEADRLLGEYKNFEIPGSLNEWFLKHQTKCNKKIKREKIRKSVIRISKRVAMIILVIGITSGVVKMSVEAFRIRFLNMIIETTNKFSTMQIEEKNNVDYVGDLPQE